MRLNVLWGTTVIFLALPLTVLAGTDASYNDATSRIMADQSVSQVSSIDCDKVSDEQFKELGEAFMSLRHPEEEEHEAMDAMMGGDGSETLRLMHVNMGKASIGCGEFGGFGMMGGNMMGFQGDYSALSKQAGYPKVFQGYPMHMWGLGSSWNPIGWVTTILVWTLLGFGIAYLWKQLKKK